MVILSTKVVPLTLNVTVIAEVVMEEMVCPEMFRAAVTETVTAAAVLNVQPDGALIVSVTPVPAEKSDETPSFKTILPSVVYAGVVALAALSAEILVPPDAVVMVTAAFEVSVVRIRQIKNRASVWMAPFSDLPSLWWVSFAFIVCGGDHSGKGCVW